MIDQLTHLVRLQGLILEAREAQQRVDSAPERLAEIEERFRERNAEYVAIRQRFDALDQDQKSRTGELQLLEEQHRKYKDDLMQVQNQREYAAILREIDSIKTRIAEHEEAILKDMEEMESAKADLDERDEHIKTERESVEKERGEVESTADAARADIERLNAERKALEAELPDALVASVRRLEEGRQGLFLAKALDGTCQSCYVRIRPQVFQEIKLARKIHYCGSCRRLLYSESSLNPSETEAGSAGSAGATEAASPGRANVEAVDGGARTPG